MNTFKQNKLVKVIAFLLVFSLTTQQIGFAEVVDLGDSGIGFEEKFLTYLGAILGTQMPKITGMSWGQIYVYNYLIPKVTRKIVKEMDLKGNTAQMVQAGLGVASGSLVGGASLNQSLTKAWIAALVTRLTKMLSKLFKKSNEVGQAFAAFVGTWVGNKLTAKFVSPTGLSFLDILMGSGLVAALLRAAGIGRNFANALASIARGYAGYLEVQDKLGNGIKSDDPYEDQEVSFFAWLRDAIKQAISEWLSEELYRALDKKLTKALRQRGIYYMGGHYQAALLSSGLTNFFAGAIGELITDETITNEDGETVETIPRGFIQAGLDSLREALDDAFTGTVYWDRYKTNKYGYYVDENGNPLDENGNPVDENGNPVDENGNPVDENGNPIGEDGEYIREFDFLGYAGYISDIHTYGSWREAIFQRYINNLLYSTESALSLLLTFQDLREFILSKRRVEEKQAQTPPETETPEETPPTETPQPEPAVFGVVWESLDEEDIQELLSVLASEFGFVPDPNQAFDPNNPNASFLEAFGKCFYAILAKLAGLSSDPEVAQLRGNSIANGKKIMEEHPEFVQWLVDEIKAGRITEGQLAEAGLSNAPLVYRILSNVLYQLARTGTEPQPTGVPSETTQPSGTTTTPETGQPSGTSGPPSSGINFIIDPKKLFPDDSEEDARIPASFMQVLINFGYDPDSADPAQSLGAALEKYFYHLLSQAGRGLSSDSVYPEIRDLISALDASGASPEQIGQAIKEQQPGFAQWFLDAVKTGKITKEELVAAGVGVGDPDAMWRFLKDVVEVEGGIQPTTAETEPSVPVGPEFPELRRDADKEFWRGLRRMLWGEIRARNAPSLVGSPLGEALDAQYGRGATEALETFVWSKKDLSLGAKFEILESTRLFNRTTSTFRSKTLGEFLGTFKIYDPQGYYQLFGSDFVVGPIGRALDENYGLGFASEVEERIILSEAPLYSQENLFSSSDLPTFFGLLKNVAPEIYNEIRSSAFVYGPLGEALDIANQSGFAADIEAFISASETLTEDQKDELLLYTPDAETFLNKFREMDPEGYNEFLEIWELSKEMIADDMAEQVTQNLPPASAGGPRVLEVTIDTPIP